MTTPRSAESTNIQTADSLGPHTADVRPARRGPRVTAPAASAANAEPACARTDRPPAVRIDRLRVRYSGTTAVDEVSIAFPAGRITAIIGPSGCGKTSLLWSINRLIEMVPQARVTGDVRIDGRSVFDREIDLRALRRDVGLIMQQPTVFPLSIWNNLEIPLRDAGGLSAAERRERIEAALHETGLWEEVRQRLSAPAGALSGGQRQRLCLARALVLQPRVLLLDEPCSALDPLAAAQIEALLQRLRGRVTMIIVTHNLAQAQRLADHVALMWTFDSGGRLVEAGGAQEFFRRPRHPLTRAYLAAEGVGGRT